MQINGDLIVSGTEKTLSSAFEIQETGSNSNGNYIKFTNGTMICYGETFGESATYVDVNFPESFIDVNYGVTVTPTWNYHREVGSVLSHLETTYFRIHYFFTTTNGNISEKQEFRWIAIGTWK